MKIYENMKHGTEEFPVGIHNTKCPNGFSLYPHIHREFEFLVMTKGRGTLYIETEKFELREGEGVFINSEELHIGIKTDNEESEFFAIVFSPEFFGSQIRNSIMQKYVEPVIKRKIRPKRRIDKSVIELLKLVYENPNELKIKSLLYEIWDICLRDAEKSFDAEKYKSIEEMKAVMEFIRENYHRNISLSDMADSINVSCGYLCREFKRVLYMTPFEYLIRVRIDKGCELLKNTDLSIGEIGEKCGFNSFSYFTKKFGEKMGRTPKEYRQK